MLNKSGLGQVYSEGNLKKKGNIIKNWKERRFLLYVDVLEYYKPEKSVPQGRILLEDAKVEKTSTSRVGFEVHTPKRIYYMEADTELEKEKWFIAIKDRITFLRAKDEPPQIQTSTSMRRTTRRDTLLNTAPKTPLPMVKNTDEEKKDIPVKEDEEHTSPPKEIKTPMTPKSPRRIGLFRSQPESPSEDVVAPRRDTVKEAKDLINGLTQAFATPKSLPEGVSQMPERKKFMNKNETAEKLAEKVRARKLEEEKRVQDEKKHVNLKSEAWIKTRAVSKIKEDPVRELEAIDPNNIDTKFTGYYVNFLSILTVPEMKEAFLKHLDTEANCEPMEFLMQLEKFTCDHIFAISDEDVDLFHSICDTFIAPNSKKEINISAPIRERIMRIHEQNKGDWSESETPLDTLEGARTMVLGDFKSDVFPRFLASSLGYQTVVKNYLNPDVITVDPSISIHYKLEKYLYGTNFEEINTGMAKNYAKVLSKEKSFMNYYLLLDWNSIVSFEQEINPQSDFLTRTEDPTNNRDDLKVYITFLEKENRRKHFRRFGFTQILSPIFNNVKKEYEGSLEYIPALIIGEWLLFYDDYELCIPKRILSDSDIMKLSLQVGMVKNDESLRENLAKFITNWNITKKYGHSKMQSEKIFVNSQDFIDELVSSLEIDLLLTGPFEKFLSLMREKGKSPLLFQTKKKEVVFHNHVDLDKFVEKIFNDEPQFDQKYTKEFEMLRYFDLMFTKRGEFIQKEIEKLEKLQEFDNKALKEEICQKKLCAPLIRDGDCSFCHFKHE